LHVTGSAVLDSEAFGASAEDLYRIHAPAAHRVARSITRNPDDAADAVAEAFAGVLEAVAAGRVSGSDGFRPYLLAATRNASIDILRRTERLTPTDEDGTLDGAVLTAGPSDRVLAGEDHRLVAEAFSELPARWRAVLWLTEVERLAPREVAPLLELTPNNVAQLAVRARGRLRWRYLQLHVRNHAAGDCLEATEQLGGLVAGELTTVQANRVRGHLAECEECRDRLAELDDLGLCLRRAATPAAALLYRLRPGRWPWSLRRKPWPTGTRGSTGRSTGWLSAIDPTTPAALLDLASSPAVQNVAASVMAGLLALGVAAAVVRDDGRSGRQRPAALAAPPAAVTVVQAEPPTTTTPATPATTVATTTPAPVTTTTMATTTTVVTTTTLATAAPAAAPAESRPPFVPRGPLTSATPSMVAQALVASLPVYDRPGGTAVRVLANPQPSGAPLVLLVTDQQAGWVKALLPVRPNGSTGWIRADQVSLTTHNFRIVIELGAHRLTAYQGTQVLLSEPVALGTADAPTPGGLYYTKELFQPLDRAGNLDPGGPYGPYAYGLSGYSEVLFDFAGGDGQFGIHGTNDPSLLGRDVSHGCVRMSNAGITKLAQTLPLGVPVEILP
jgi:RNA polymerase sigma factor (sigma-70 family)